MQRVTAAAWLLSSEGDELHWKRRRLLAHHRGQLQHDCDARCVVLRARRDRHGVEVCADHHMWLLRVEALRFCDDVERRPPAHRRTPGDTGRYRHLGPPHVVSEALESGLDELGGLGVVA